MKIAGLIFLATGIIIALLGGLWLQADAKIDVVNVGALVFGIEMVLIGIWFLHSSEDPSFKRR